MAKVTEVTLGRLHNLGNYEHIRYEVRVAVAGGENPGLVISRLENLLAALAPIKTDYDYERALRIMSDPEQAKDERAGNIEIYKQRIEDHDKAVKRRARALQLFIDLDGVSAHVDAKDKWEDDGYWDYDEGDD